MGKKKVISKAKLKQMVEERDNDESRIEFIATEVVNELLPVIASTWSLDMAEGIYDIAEYLWEEVDSRVAIEYLEIIATMSRCETTRLFLDVLKNEADDNIRSFFEWFAELGEYSFDDIFLEGFMKSLE